MNNLDIMPVKKCAWGTCPSNSRYMHTKRMEGVQFYRFPDPRSSCKDSNAKVLECKTWIKACGRPRHQLNIDIIIQDYATNKHYYNICSKVSLLSCNLDLLFHIASIHVSSSIIDYQWFLNDIFHPSSTVGVKFSNLVMQYIIYTTFTRSTVNISQWYIYFLR